MAAFTEFFRDAEPRLRQAFVARLGAEAGREAASDALAYAWQRWGEISKMENPVGYLYVYGRGRGLDRLRRSNARFEPPDHAEIPHIEPKLLGALEALPARQRTVVMLLHSFQWSMSEVAELLGISKSSVQSHAERGLARLRRTLGVTI